MEGQGGGPHRKGWYPDPAGSGQVRWWDGAAWTDHLASAEQVTPEPLTSGRVGKVVLIVLGLLAASALVVLLLVGACVALIRSVGY